MTWNFLHFFFESQTLFLLIAECQHKKLTIAIWKLLLKTTGKNENVNDDVIQIKKAFSSFYEILLSESLRDAGMNKFFDRVYF